MPAQLPTSEGKQAVEKNQSIFSSEEQAIVDTLVKLDQAHIFAKWPAAGQDDDKKHRLLKQIIDIDNVYPSGIGAYVDSAKVLLKASAEGANPYEGYTASEPKDSVRLESTADFDKYEKLGLESDNGIAKSAYVIVAGGLGERLGYKGIKLALPSEITTETPFIQLYIQHLQAAQQYLKERTGKEHKLPLAIMTSDDTDNLTRELLQKNDNFGMGNDQLIVFKQGKVPALIDNDAHFTLEDGGDGYTLDTKPHGHGDVHSLLYSEGIVKKWTQQHGVEWIVFLQDTNGLVFRALPSALGVSIEKNLHMNSLTVPRVQGDAVGAICTLTRNKDALPPTKDSLPSPLTINVEYNQLEGLLGKGVKEPTTSNGQSVYPGNINVLIFKAKEYYEVLEDKKGAIAEFVNPKYNPDKQSFKKPTRLECMMQDYPKLLASGNDYGKRVGFSQYPKWTSFSAVKNALVDAAAKQKSGNAPECGSSGECDMYYWNYHVLSEAGVKVDKPKKTTYCGVEIEEPPHLVFSPFLALSQAELRQKFGGKDQVKISQHSTFVLKGRNIKVESLQLDGALVIEVTNPSTPVVIKNLTVSNRGWSFKALSDDELKSVDQKYAVRGYTLQQEAGETYKIDGSDGKEVVLSDETKSTYKSQ